MSRKAEASAMGMAERAEGAPGRKKRLALLSTAARL